MITKATDYAIRVLVYMSKKSFGSISTKKEISEKCNIPAQFLAKIVQNLSKSRIIHISKGAKGGYKLSKHPEEITLLDIIEVMEGRIFLNQCIKEKEVCEYSSYCVVHGLWNNLTENLRKELNKVNFKELAKKDTCFLVH